MTPLVAAFRRIGGPDAVTWIAFWASFTGNLIGQFAVGPPVETSMLIRVAAVAASQMAMFVPLVVLRFTVLRRPARPLPWVTVLGFIVAILIRNLVLAGILDAASQSTTSTWWPRVIASFINLFVVLMLAALVVSTVREHARALARLGQVQADSEATIARLHELVEQRNQGAVDRVMETLDDAMSELEGADDADAVRALQRLATDIVRPMSHELALSIPSWRIDSNHAPHAKVTWRDVMRALGRHGSALPSAPGPFLPLLTGIVMFGVLFGSVSQNMPTRRWEVLLTAFAGSSLGLLVANYIVRRLLPLRSLTQSMALVVGTAVGAAVIPSVIVGLLVGGIPGVVLTIGGTIFVSAIALMAAVIATVLREQRRTEAELRVSTEQLRSSIARLHQVQWYQQKSLSRALHGPVQSAATAAALRLDAAVRSGTATPGLVDEIRTSLRREIDVLDAPVQQPLEFSEFSARLTGTWTGVCEVDVHADDTVVAILDSDPVLRSTISETMTEAVSNAVRHGKADVVELHLTTANDEALLLQVTDNGHSGESADRGGLGSRLLDECTLQWDLVALPTGSRLDATFPLQPGGWRGALPASSSAE